MCIQKDDMNMHEARKSCNWSFWVHLITCFVGLVGPYLCRDGKYMVCKKCVYKKDDMKMDKGRKKSCKCVSTWINSLYSL